MSAGYVDVPIFCILQPFSLLIFVISITIGKLFRFNLVLHFSSITQYSWKKKIVSRVT